MGRRLTGGELAAAKEKLRREFETFAKVQGKMEAPFMTVDHVQRRLGVSRRQVVYWYTKAMKRANVRGKSKQAWHRFSIVDLIGFGALKELRGLRVSVEGSVRLLDYIRENVTRKQRLLYPLARGEPVAVFVDGKDVGSRVGIETQRVTFITSVFGDKGALVMVSLGYIFREVMGRASRKDFSVQFLRGDKDKVTRAVFSVDGEKIELAESSSINLGSGKP